MITKEVKNHQRYFLDYHLIMIRSTSRWFTLVSTLDEAIGCKFVLIQISISLLLLKFKDEKTIEILKSVLKRFGNRSTTNCRIRWSDATKAGFYSGGRSSWWLPDFFDLHFFSFSGHNVLFTFPQSDGCSLVTCQGFSTPPWTNSGLSITRKTRGSSSLPPATTSTGSRSTWCKNKTRIFSSLMSFWQQVGRPFPTIGL